MTSTRPKSVEIGERHTVLIEKVAHGGHFIARHEGQVFFVRHAIPGETVEVEITSSGSSFLRADVVSVIDASMDRVTPPCQYAHPGGCGGCDFQHISLARQRNLKAEVIKEQFRRLAKMEIDVTVEEVSGPFHWRTRMTGATDESGKIGFYATRSHKVIPVAECLIAADAVKFPELAQRIWPAQSRVEISVSSEGVRSIALAAAIRGSKARLTQGPQILKESVYGHELEVSQASFWQGHELAPETLTGAIQDYVHAGEHLLDLYGGVGLFTAALIDQIGETGRIDLIESSRSATADAARNFAQVPQVRVLTGDVLAELSKIDRADVVLLDPPREGAGRAVLGKIAAFGPRSIIYVACDPAALARDTAYLADLGFRLVALRAFDLFPMTHHVECVARFEPSQS